MYSGDFNYLEIKNIDTYLILSYTESMVIAMKDNYVEEALRNIKMKMLWPTGQGFHSLSIKHS